MGESADATSCFSLIWKASSNVPLFHVIIVKSRGLIQKAEMYLAWLIVGGDQRIKRLLVCVVKHRMQGIESSLTKTGQC